MFHAVVQAGFTSNSACAFVHKEASPNRLGIGLLRLRIRLFFHASRFSRRVLDGRCYSELGFLWILVCSFWDNSVEGTFWSKY